MNVNVNMDPVDWSKMDSIKVAKAMERLKMMTRLMGSGKRDGEGGRWGGLLTREQTEWCKVHLSYDDWWVDEKGEVRVEGQVDLVDTWMEEIPVQFGDVGGYFSCYGCTHLKSLKGAPRRVGMSFYCINCPALVSLEGGPLEVEGEVIIRECESLKKLEGFPKAFGSVTAEGHFEAPDAQFLKDVELQEKWKGTTMEWREFLYTGGAARGRRFGL